MKELDHQEWNKFSAIAAKKFGNVIGHENVRVDEAGIHLTFAFNPLDGGRGLPHRFGMLVADLKVLVKSEEQPKPLDRIVGLEATDVTFIIPRKQPNLDNVLLLADRLVVPKVVEKDGEKRIPITANEPEFALQQMTGVPWEHVQHSPYASQVVEPAFKPGNRKTRDQQEYGVGYVLNGAGAHGKVKEWLHHQEAVEGDTREPRTVLPVEWVSRVGLDNIRSADADMKASLPKVFKRS